MREVLFRGKRIDRKDSGEWIEGDLLTNCTRSDCEIRNYDINSVYYGKSYSVDQETVSEFTGLYDKNGKRIFENDILKIKSWVKGDFLNGALTREDCALVQYDAKTGGYRLKVYNNGKYKRISRFTTNHLFAYDAEVIGNKWDNPELLEKCRT